jgi:putative ABC transport system permease protein
MIFNYFRLAWRNLTANKTVSFINIFGLSIAVACCVTVFLFLKNYWSLDNFHTNGDRIFIVEYKTETDGQVQLWGDAPAPMAYALANDFPQVERTVRMRREGAIVSSGEHTFEETLTYADTGYFAMFTFPLSLGNPAALADPDAVILSTTMAQKYFPNEMPVGRTLSLTTGENQKKNFIVQGVAAPFPDNADLRFDLLIGYRSTAYPPKTDEWATGNGNVFVLLRQPADAPSLANQMSRYLPLFNAHNTELPATAFTLDNLKHPAPGAYDVNRRPAEAPHPIFAAMMSAIALVLLALSCFNYVNISLGAASRRLKEIGIRKVMGGKRQDLVWQFMAENLLLCFLSLLLGLVFCQTIFAPMLNGIMVNMNLGLSFVEYTDLWLFLVVLLALTALASGAYPALYVSAFRPIAIFSGKLKFGSNNAFRRGLLTAQFSLAFFAVILSVVLLSAGKNWSTMAWGYDPSQTWMLQLTDSTQFSLLKNDLLKNPNVLGIAGTSSHVGQNFTREEVKTGDKTTEVRRFDIGAGYAEVLGLGLQSGRFFEENRRVEDESLVVVNDIFVEKQGWSDAIGLTVRVAEKNYTVAGVVRNFKIFGTGVAQPAVFFRTNEASFGLLAVRYAPGSGHQVAEQAKQDYQRLFGGAPINHFFQRDVFEGFNTSVWSLIKAFGYIAALALIIACLGLYGLAMQQFAKRMKEVSVRKLLGASVAQIVLLVNREFIVMLLLAGGISTTLSFVGFRLILHNLEDYFGPYRPGILPFLIANLLVFTTAAFAIGQHSWRLAQVQLAEVLKNSE